MQRYLNNIHNNPAFLWVTSGTLIITVLALVRKFVYQQGPLIKGIPDVSLLYAVSTVCIIIAMAMMYFPLRSLQPASTPLFSNNNVRQQLSLLLGISLSIFLSLLFILKQEYFNLISYEDKLIEWLSFIFLSTGFLLFILSVKKSFKHKDNIQLQVQLMFFTLLYALIALEEVSWFSRALGIETPALFKNNQQNEINLHNFFTDYSENLYYFGTHLYFVTLPILALCLGIQNSTRTLRILLAKPHLIAVAMIASTYNYNMWNSILIQLTFFSSVIALLVLYAKNDLAHEKIKILLFLGFLMITQALYLCNGERYQRLHEITEFKELFIAITLFIYAIDVFQEIKNQQGIKEA